MPDPRQLYGRKIACGFVTGRQTVIKMRVRVPSVSMAVAHENVICYCLCHWVLSRFKSPHEILFYHVVSFWGPLQRAITRRSRLRPAD